MEEREAVIDGLVLHAASGGAPTHTAGFVDDERRNARLMEDASARQPRHPRANDENVVHEFGPPAYLTEPTSAAPPCSKVP